MRLATILAPALCVAVPAPIAAFASGRVTGMHKHRVHFHHVVRGSFRSHDSISAAGREVWRRQVRWCLITMVTEKRF
jgi:hypothetical protein